MVCINPDVKSPIIKTPTQYGRRKVPRLNLNYKPLNLNNMENFTKTAIIAKISETGKTILVGLKSSPFQIGYDFAWASNPFGAKATKGQVIEGFAPVSKKPITKDGAVLQHTDGTPVMAWQF